MKTSDSLNKRVVIVYWKNRPENPFEVFSSLKNFCISYSEYNYNTLSNYLSKNKIAYENAIVRVERKEVYLRPKADMASARKIIPVVRRVALKEAEDYVHDVNYWWSKTPFERLSAAAFIVRQSLDKGRVLDKTKMVRKKQKA